jgi:acetyl-CoA synthetase
VHEIVDHGWIGQRRGVAETAVFILGDLAQDSPHDLARAGLRQAGRKLDQIGRCDWTNFLAHPADKFLAQVFGGLFAGHQRFVDTYFKTYPGKYFTGDGCRRDEDGYYWITGRVDDVINVAGHRLGTAEVESALVAHPKVSEAAVVGYPHDIKGQGIYAYVTLMAGEKPTEDLRKELVGWVRKEIGPIASPDLIQFAPGLPKTRSGKIMRRILRKIAEDEFGNLGDTSTLADPAVVDDLVNNRQNKKTAKAGA